MTVGELLDYLATQPRERRIVMAKDAEGNGYSPLNDADEGMYVAESTWSGTVYVTPEEHDRVDAIGGGDQFDEAPDGAVRVVVLGPVN